MSTIVAGADFGTLSVRVSIFDSERGRLGVGISPYPLHRKENDPDYATQSHSDHMSALADAMHKALADSNVSGSEIKALAIDTTGSSVLPVDARMQPLGEYYLWCDHRAWREAAEITERAQSFGLKAIDWSGGVYSSEWGFAKLLHWLRHNPEKHGWFASAFEHATSSRRPCAASPIRSRPRAASARWGTNGSGTNRWADCLRKNSWSPSTLYWQAFVKNCKAATRLRT